MNTEPNLSINDKEEAILLVVKECVQLTPGQIREALMCVYRERVEQRRVDRMVEKLYNDKQLLTRSFPFNETYCLTANGGAALYLASQHRAAIREWRPEKP